MTQALDVIEQRLMAVAQRLVDQDRARVIVPPQKPASGFWFGGGNMTVDPQGRLVVVGRYRNVGDSRTGLQAGERGLELAVFRSEDRGESFQKLLSFTKSDLNVGDHEVLSIEGSALHWTVDGVELFVSTEKSGVGYPSPWESYLKPNSGVWTIDQLVAPSLDELKSAGVETILTSDDPGHLHVKDPAVYDSADGDTVLIYCTHPFSWSSSNSALVIRRKGEASFVHPRFEFFNRGSAWDVAITRATALVDLPVTAMADLPPTSETVEQTFSLLFYDGGESLRNLDEHATAVKRPRGYSCEELGGVAYVIGDDVGCPQRLSKYLPTFVSPYGTGCSRYVDVLATDDNYYATWQQSQPDLSQPLVMNVVPRSEIEGILRGE